ncbi:hypothetical protein E2I00_016899, partial [Balaenoptera physalus]
SLAAPSGYGWLCGTPQNEGPKTSAPQGKFGPYVNAYPHINNEGLWINIGRNRTGRGLSAPWGGFAYHEVTLENLTNTLERLAPTTGDALKTLSTALNSLASVVMDNRLALDYLLAEEGDICAVINETYCTYVNKSGQIKMDNKKIYEQASWSDPNTIWSTIKSALPSFTWFLPLLGQPCVFNLLVKFVSSRLQQFHIKMMAMRGLQPILPSDLEQEAVLPLGFLDHASRDIYSLTGRVDTPTHP